MENKFKIGDRVRVVECADGTLYDIGYVGTVTLWYCNQVGYQYFIEFDCLKKLNQESHWQVPEAWLAYENPLIRCE